MTNAVCHRLLLLGFLASIAAVASCGDPQIQDEPELGQTEEALTVPCCPAGFDPELKCSDGRILCHPHGALCPSPGSCTGNLGCDVVGSAKYCCGAIHCHVGQHCCGNDRCGSDIGPTSCGPVR